MRTYGVELECVVDRDWARDALCIALNTSLNRVTFARASGKAVYKTYHLNNGWKVSFDPCLRESGVPVERCVEVISPPISTKEEPERLWQSVLHGLCMAGATRNSRCGMHVHRDASGFTPSGLVAICREVDRRRFALSEIRGGYARPIPQSVLKLDDPTEDELKRVWFAGYKQGVPENGRGRLHPARHRLVNLGSVWYRGTIEFRMFDATLDPEQFRKNLAIVDEICSIAS